MPPFTPAVARALEVAPYYALAQNAAAITPGHLLHGLLEEEEGRAASLVRAAGLALDVYLATLGARPEESAASLPLGEQTREALALARDLAVELTGESTLSSEPVLLALLRTDADLTARLETFGLRLADLETKLEHDKPVVARLEEPLVLVAPTEQMDVCRILDVGANRAREALRVIEDYCRFVLEDGFLSGELKALRHDFTAALHDLGPAGMLQARETLRDVGTTISTEAEHARSSPLHVVEVNLKRLQEALRSLEEFGKVSSPTLGEQMEQMRYRAYTLERAVLLGAEARERLRHAHLYVLLTGASCATGLERTIEEAAAGGAAIFQLREKTLNDRELLARARDVRRWTRRTGTLFIVNDRPDVARLVEADGVHLGQDDMPVKDARRILGPEAIIGVSTHTIEQVRQAVRDGAGYLGVGPTFPSTTKTFADFPGVAFVQAALAETTLPAFAIGGVNAKTIAAVVAAGARRAAVSQAVAGSDHPGAAAQTLLAALAGPPPR